jgi:hypothetical protein
LDKLGQGRAAAIGLDAGYRTPGGHVADIERISVEEAHRKAGANAALLVCAYQDEDKCRKINLDGSISLAAFQSKVASLPKTQELIFYCA